MKEKVKIFYDGACPICTNDKKNFEKKLPKDNQVDFIDISEKKFQAEKYGLDPNKVQKIMHISVEGKIHKGVDAFLELGKIIPQYEKFIPLLGSWPIKKVLEIGYSFFAFFRPHVPGRKDKK